MKIIDVSKQKGVSAVKSSKFLDNLFSTPAKLDKLNEVIKEIQEVAAERRNDESFHYLSYSFPLNFREPMILSANEESVIVDAILKMSQNIHDKKYAVAPTIFIINFAVSDKDQRDLPFPNIMLTIKCPESIAPRRGFYLRGVFKRDMRTREMVSARITKITYFTKDDKEMELLTFF
jgi:hypothetical protein